jgi:hypothetical protein
MKIGRIYNGKLKCTQRLRVWVYLAFKNVTTVLAHASTAVAAVTEEPSILYSTQNMCSAMFAHHRFHCHKCL